MENSGLVVVDKKDVVNENAFIDNKFDLFGSVQIGSKIRAQCWARGKNFPKQGNQITALMLISFFIIVFITDVSPFWTEPRWLTVFT